MNATQPVFKAPPSNDALQLNGSPSADSQSSRTNSQDFAAALSDAGDAKPARKNTVKSHADSGGGAMPPGGNQPPSAAGPAQQAASQAAAGAQSSGDGTVAGTGGSGAANSTGTPAAAPTGAGAAASGTGSAASGAGAAAPGTSPGTPNNASNAASNDAGTQAQDPALAVGIAQVPAATTDTASPDSQVGADAITAMPPQGPSMPHAVAMAAPPKAVPPAGAAATKPQDVAGKTGTPGAPVAKTDDAGKAASADSAAAANDAASFSNTPAASNTPAGTSATDPTAQAIMAAGAQTSAPPPQSSSQTDDSEVDSGVASPGALGATGSPAAAVASSAMQAAKATAASVTAAASASIAEALSASAGAVAVAADKHTRGSGADLSISGSSTDGTAGAAQLLTSVTTTSSDVPTPTFKVPASVDTAEFGQGVADRVSLMMDGNLTSAKLQVNPPALGPIEVRIALQSGHAQVWFTSHSAVTRDALESSAPKLREMLGAQGFGQVSVDISQRSFQERSPQPKGYAASPAIGGGSAAAPVQSSSASSRSASSLLDAYA